MGQYDQEVLDLREAAEELEQFGGVVEGNIACTIGDERLSAICKTLRITADMYETLAAAAPSADESLIAVVEAECAAYLRGENRNAFDHSEFMKKSSWLTAQRLRQLVERLGMANLIGGVSSFGLAALAGAIGGKVHRSGSDG